MRAGRRPCDQASMELPLDEATDRFIGKTIAKIDASSCNNVELLFTDGSRVALHIDCDGMGLPEVTACTHCVEITA